MPPKLQRPISMSVEAIPTVTVSVPPDRDYGPVVTQTKAVYDELLANKHSHLVTALFAKKAQYDTKAAELQAIDEDQAMEFGVRAQEALNKMQGESHEELNKVQVDYQHKMNYMLFTMEKEWKEKQLDGPAVHCTMYKHK